MSETRLVGVHLGTSSVRIAVYDPDGTLLSAGEAPIEEQTTIAWERALRSATPDLPPSGTCSIASTSGTVLLVDEYGEPVFPPQMYYESAPEQAEQLRESGNGSDLTNWDVVSSSTGPLAKVLRLRRDHPRRFEDVEWILSPTTWLLYRLRYGRSRRWQTVETDWTNAMKFGADITVSMPEWDETLFEACGLSASLFPAIRPPGSYIGPAESEVATRIGFGGCNLYQGMTDGSASVLANGCLEPGDFSVTFGATSVIKYVLDEITPHEALYYHRHPLDGYILGASFDSGSVLRWYFDHVLDVAPEHGFELAKSTTPGDEYEVFLQGHRSPLYNPAVGTSLLGVECDAALSTEEVRGRIVRGLMTGIVLAEWTYIYRIQEHFETTIDRVQLVNDGAPSLRDDYSWWNELRSQIWNRSISEMQPRMTAGLLIPAALITSEYADSSEAIDCLLRRRSEIEPDREQNESYDERRDEYLDRWHQVAELYDRE
ncbi:FGGY family carbohydrate kinase [Natrarchaeobius oligotrophus]|uniref:Xylulose kinase n=1 Tax=Natrarchaeobius chitinivorans TaxID=1679083 RepID=A0A3N6M6G5_NATCH|nr:FGGY family carbohydrate kinase [Natrarchaeobius chitinivorans]RQG99168.1 xylulose kinase [Natrarchaeobius chitinivorans]